MINFSLKFLFKNFQTYIKIKRIIQQTLCNPHLDSLVIIFFTYLFIFLNTFILFFSEWDYPYNFCLHSPGVNILLYTLLLCLYIFNWHFFLNDLLVADILNFISKYFNIRTFFYSTTMPLKQLRKLTLICPILDPY